jgi:hypothetical protein
MTYFVFMPATGILQIWRKGDRSWVEIRGDYDVEDASEFQRVIDAMPGWHVSVLFAQDVLQVLPSHPDWQLIDQVYHSA